MLGKSFLLKTDATVTLSPPMLFLLLSFLRLSMLTRGTAGLRVIFDPFDLSRESDDS